MSCIDRQNLFDDFFCWDNSICLLNEWTSIWFFDTIRFWVKHSSKEFLYWPSDKVGPFDYVFQEILLWFGQFSTFLTREFRPNNLNFGNVTSSTMEMWVVYSEYHNFYDIFNNRKEKYHNFSMLHSIQNYSEYFHFVKQ